MKSNKKIILIGESPMLLNCILFSNFYFKNIIVVSKDIKIIKKIPKKIKIFSSLKKVEIEEYDFLFSIMSKIIIDKKILKKKIVCLNFHDAYLPNYAGVYTSTWSILNNEKNHGVTWHKITDKIDQGNFLLRKKFKIKKNDTSLDIDYNSITIGYYLFKKIIFKIIKNEKFKYFKQNLNKFRYYGYKDREKIPNYGFIDLNEKIEKIFNLYRALNFSKQKSKVFCKLKLFTNKGVIIVKKIEIIKKKKNFIDQKKNYLSYK